MAKDFQGLWKDVTGAEDEAAAIRALAEILVEKDGRAFVSRLELKYTEFCIDVLDRVSHDSRISSFFAVSNDLARASQDKISKPQRDGLSLSR